MVSSTGHLGSSVSEFDISGEMECREPIHLDGRAYSRAALRKYCRESENDPSLEPWKQKVLHFIGELLDPDVSEFEQKTSGTTGDPYVVTGTEVDGSITNEVNTAFAVVGADLHGADLRGANLRWANLEMAHLNESALGGVNLRRADLKGTNLEMVNLGRASLRRAKFSAETVWPEGFDPEEADATLVD